MNLSPVARGVNALCQELGARQLPPAEPVLYRTEPLPPSRFWRTDMRFVENAGRVNVRWVSVDEARAMFEPARDLTGELASIGIDWGLVADTTVYWDMGVFGDCRRILDEQDRRASRRRLDGWWAKIGGNPPTFWPKTIEQKDLEEVFGHAQAMGDGAVRTWFDEVDQRFRAERVEIQKKDAPILERIDAAIEDLALGKMPAATTTASAGAAAPDLDLVKHYLRLAGIMRSMPAPQEPLRLTRREYIRFTTQMDIYKASGRRAGLNTLAGLSIEIIPGT